MAVGWSLAFLGAAIVIGTHYRQLAVIGMVLAAAELAAATAIWLARGGAVGGDDDGRGPGPDEPQGPSGGKLPQEYWSRWEEQFEDSEAPWG